MEEKHLLNLRALGDATLGDYSLLRFEGREAISEPFDYHLELTCRGEPADVSGWIGKLAEWDLTLDNGDERVFAGRIYETELVMSGDILRIRVRVRPAWWAVAYARATHFVQDKTSRDIFEAMTADVPGLVASISLSPAPPKRGYSVRYDETEYDYLSRLLAQDGIMYFFAYERSSGPYRHKMIVANAPSAYTDVEGADALTMEFNASGNPVRSLEHRRRATTRVHDHHGFDVNKLDTPWKATGNATETWGKVYAHSYESIGEEADATGDVTARARLLDEGRAQAGETVSGTSQSVHFCAGGKIVFAGTTPLGTGRLVLTAVNHSAFDPSSLPGKAAPEYRNSFTAMDATKAFRPALPPLDRKAPGPLLGTVGLDGAAEGEAKIDDEQRIPVLIAQARDYAGSKPLPKVVWLPVKQQWSHATHGAQFFPRIGARVIIDFLYGNPDLPFVTGTVYSPSQKYPFDPASKATQTGWRSVTDKNGDIRQEFLFEDKPGSEEIYLYSGRDYRRLIDNDDWGTVKRDQTLIVERDQKLTVEKDRTVKIEGLEKIDITKTQTVTVTDAVLYESKKEIVIKVGSSTITLKPTSIEIKAVKIDIKADAAVTVKGGAKVGVEAPQVEVKADAMLTLKGGIVMIN